MKLSTRRRLMARRLGNPAGSTVSVLHIQPRDTLVVFVPATISAEQAQRAAQYFRQAAGHERVLVVDNRTGLGVLRGGRTR
jgi:hypothetical protein